MSENRTGAEAVPDMWAVGDYEPLSERLAPAAVALVDALEPGPGDHVLDLAAGLGSLAEAASERGAAVTATDSSPVMIARGRARLANDAVTWLQGDLGRIPLESASVDVVASSFGLLFAADPARALGEILRVLVPGGRLAFSAWTPEGAMGRMATTMVTFAPADSGMASAVASQHRWGTPDAARSLLTAAGFVEIQSQERTLPWRFSDPASMTRFLRAHSPAHIAFAAALGGGADRMFAAVEEVFAPQGGPVDADVAYLAVTARRPSTQADM